MALNTRNLAQCLQSLDLLASRLQAARSSEAVAVLLEEVARVQACLAENYDDRAFLLAARARQPVLLLQDHLVLYANAAASNLLGVTGESDQEDFLDLVAPEERSRVEFVLQNTLRRDGASDLAGLTMLDNMGRARRYEARLYALPDLEGAALVLLRDQAVAAGGGRSAPPLDESDVYRRIFDNSHAVMLVIDPTSGAILDANPAAVEFYGWSHDLLTAMKISDINVLTPGEVRREMERARSANRRQFHFRHRLASGELRDVEVFSGPVELGGRKILFSIIHDITKRVRAEVEIQKNLLALRQAETIASLGYFERNWQTGSGYWSDGFCSLLGLPPGTLLSHGEFMQFVHEKDRSRVAAHIRQSLDDHAPMDIEFKLVRQDGTQLEIHGIANNSVDARGNTHITRGTFQDITERKRAQEDLQERVKELNCLYQLDQVARRHAGAPELVLQEAVRLLAEAVKFPDRAVARIRWHDLLFEAGRFATSIVELGTELLVKDEAVGWVEVGYHGEDFASGEDPFLPEETSLLEAVAEKLGKVIEAKLAQEALDRRRRLERLLTSLSSSLMQVDRLDERIEEALEAIGDFLEMDRAYVFLLREDGDTLDNTHEWVREDIAPQKEHLQGISSERELPWFWDSMLEQNPVVVANPEQLPAGAEREREHWRSQSIKSLLAIPMVTDGRTIGFIGLDAVRRPRPWLEETIKPLRLTGEIIARALQHRSMVEDMEQRLVYERALRTVSRTLLTGDEEEAVLQHVLAVLQQASGASRVYIFRNEVDRDGQEQMSQVYEQCAEGVEPQLDNPQLQKLPYVPRFERWLQAFRRREWIGGPVREFPEEERELLDPQQIQAILVIPLWKGEELYGFIGFDQTGQERTWRERDMELLSLAAEMISSSLDRRSAQRELQSRAQRHA